MANRGYVQEQPAVSEHYSASTAATEVLYLRSLLERSGFEQTQPTPVSEDNTACIHRGNNVNGGRERAKNIDYVKKLLRPKQVLISHGVNLQLEYCLYSLLAH